MKRADQELSQITRNLQIVDDFVGINTEPEMTQSTNLSVRDQQVTTNIAQCETNYSNCIELHYVDFEYFDEDYVGSTSDSDLYSEQIGIALDKVKSQQKVQIHNRKTVKECTIIANNKTNPRHPSYYKFDDRTCHILETIPLKMGPLTNIAGKGNNSLVIFADYLPSNRIYFPHGCAVKVYKLGSDVKKNVAILKRAHREEEHLSSMQRFMFTLSVPYILYKSRNVIITNFIGFDQETAPSIASISVKDYLAMYQTMVEDVIKWYNKAEVVHGNLCARNVVYFYAQVCYLGWSHSVPTKHPLALTKLMKDCHFITNFFRAKGVPVKQAEQLFKEITGLDKISSKVLEGLSKKDLWKHLHPHNPNRISEDRIGISRNSRFKK